MKFLRKIFILLLLLNFSKSYSQDYRRYIGVGFGVNAWLTERGASNVVGTGPSLECGYYPKGKMGFVTGFNYLSDSEGYENMVNIPTYISYRSVSKERYPVGARAFALFFGIIFPKEVIIYAGPSWGYVNSDNNLSLVSINGGPFQPEGYITKYKAMVNFDIGIKPKFYIWHFRLGFDIGFGFFITKNFRYTSPDASIDGYKPNKNARIKASLDYVF